MCAVARVMATSQHASPGTAADREQGPGCRPAARGTPGSHDAWGPVGTFGTGAKCGAGRTLPGVQGVSSPRDAPPQPEALGLVLDAAENASPLEAVEAVTGALAAALNASAAFFLIADLSGRGLVRLSHVAAGAAAHGARQRRRGGRRPVRRRGAGEWFCPSTGAPPRRRCAPRRSRLCPAPIIRPPGDGSSDRSWVVLAPVTERGEVSGLLRADPAGRASHGRAVADLPDRARAVVRGDREPATHRPVRVGPAQHPVHPARRDPAPAAARRVHLRGRGLHPRRRGWNRRHRSAATPSTTAWAATSCTCR